MTSENLIVNIEEKIAADGRFTGGKGSSLAKLFHILGKDNVPFHSIMFPSYLIGTKDDYHLVDVLDSTAYLNYEDKKFSKSKGIGVFGDDAIDSGIAVDLWRYYLFRIRPENSDTESQTPLYRPQLSRISRIHFPRSAPLRQRRTSD